MNALTLIVKTIVIRPGVTENDVWVEHMSYLRYLDMVEYQNVIHSKKGFKFVNTIFNICYN